MKVSGKWVILLTGNQLTLLYQVRVKFFLMCLSLLWEAHFFCFEGADLSQ